MTISDPYLRLPYSPICKVTQIHRCPTQFSSVAPANRILFTCLVSPNSLQAVLYEELWAVSAGLTSKAQVSSCYSSLLIKKICSQDTTVHSSDIPHFIEFGWIKGLVVWYMNSINI